MDNKRWIVSVLVWALFVVLGHAAVEHDNVLKGVLRNEDYTVVSDIRQLTAVKTVMHPPFIFTDAGDKKYRLASRLNTIMYAGDYRSALQVFADAVPADFPGTEARLSPDADYLEVSRTFDAVMMADAYRSVLDDWRARLITMNQAIADAVEGAPKDAALPDREFTDLATVDWERDPFETREEYAARIEAGNPYQLGTVTFEAERYDIDSGNFPVLCKPDKAMAERLAGDVMFSGVVVDRGEARRLFKGGPEYPYGGMLQVDRDTSVISLSAAGLFMRAGKKHYADAFRGDTRMIALGGGVTMEIIEVLSGSFMMGSDNGSDDEKPAHQVTISKPFWLGKTEVTQAQYQQVMGTNPSRFKGANRPVEQVSWNDAMAFCRKLTALERMAGRLPAGYEYTLPTEAQWEYAARGGLLNQGYTYAGSDEIGEVAWYDGNSSKTTHAVGGLRANELGLHDMSGNVWEWCRDWYDSDYYGKTKGAVDPVNLTKASLRVNRGGSWYSSAGRCRSADRRWGRPGDAGSNLGFRVCLAPSP